MEPVYGIGPLFQVVFQNYPIRTAPSLPFGGLEATIFLIGGVCGSLLLGWGSYYLIERHFLRLEQMFRLRGAFGSHVVDATPGSKDNLAKEEPVDPVAAIDLSSLKHACLQDLAAWIRGLIAFVAFLPSG